MNHLFIAFFFLFTRQCCFLRTDSNRWKPSAEPAASHGLQQQGYHCQLLAVVAPCPTSPSFWQGPGWWGDCPLCPPCPAHCQQHRWFWRSSSLLISALAQPTSHLKPSAELKWDLTEKTFFFFWLIISRPVHWALLTCNQANVMFFKWQKKRGESSNKVRTGGWWSSQKMVWPCIYSCYNLALGELS